MLFTSSRVRISASKPTENFLLIFFSASKERMVPKSSWANPAVAVIANAIKQKNFFIVVISLWFLFCKFRLANLHLVVNRVAGTLAFVIHL